MKLRGGLIKESADDRAYRGICRSTVINFAYAVFRGVMGAVYFSVWYILLAVYFFILGIIRMTLAYSYRKKAMYGEKYEKNRYLLSGWLLLLLNIPMGGMMLLMTVTDTTGSYPGYTIYASAAYTFYMVTLSVVNLFRLRRLKSHILSAAKTVDFVAAMMSLLILQNALISEFSEDGDSFRTLMSILTGTGIYIAVIVLAACMIVGTKHMGKEKM